MRQVVKLLAEKITLRRQLSEIYFISQKQTPGKVHQLLSNKSNTKRKRKEKEYKHNSLQVHDKVFYVSSPAHTIQYNIALL